MADKTDNKEVKDEAESWQFPDVNFLSYAFTAEDEEEGEEDENEEAFIENANQASALEILKNEYQTKVTFLNEIISRLKAPILNIDQSTIEIMEEIIKKLTMRLIKKELAAEPQQFRTMVDDLNKLISQQNETSQVFVSKADYQNLINNEQNANLNLCIDESLTSGDVVIKSKYSELRAILTERVDQLMSLSHE